MKTRRLSIQEELLIELLIKRSTIRLPTNWKDNFLVSPMEDGGMGSLYLFPNGLVNIRRKFGKQVSECQFADEDGIDVIVSLNVDSEGNLFELDMWKTDFSELKKIPLILR